MNNQPKLRNFTVKPKAIDNFGRKTIESLLRRKDEIAEEIGRHSLRGSYIPGSLIAEGLAIGELLEDLRDGVITEIQ